RAVVKLALGANRSPVCKNDMLGDGKSQPGAAGFPRARFIDAVETLKKAGQMFGRNAGAEVPDVEFDAVLCRAGSENDFLSRGRVLQRILDQVGKNLMNGL